MLDSTQHPLVAIPILVILASLCLWWRALARWWRGEPLLPLVERRPVPWSVVDMLIIGCAGLVVLIVSQWWYLRQQGLPAGGWEFSELEPDQQIGLLLNFSVSSFLSWLVALTICCWRSHATARDLGLDAAVWRHDLALGLGAFVMLIVPVLAIHVGVQFVVPVEETHPFIDLISNDPRIEFLWPIALAALVIAPIVEEYLFRVLLQGWLERVGGRFEAAAHRAAGGDQPAEPDAEPAASADDLGSDARSEPRWPSAADQRNPYAAPIATAVEPDALMAADPTSGLPHDGRLRWLAIVSSAAAFALAHLDQGPAPISLFILALGLGYLYQRTHRVLPCIVVHFLVNLTAVVQLALAILSQSA
jgi:membrane protease YdiL (CAAX protease family)